MHGYQSPYCSACINLSFKQSFLKSRLIVETDNQLGGVWGVQILQIRAVDVIDRAFKFSNGDNDWPNS